MRRMRRRQRRGEGIAPGRVLVAAVTYDDLKHTGK